MKTVIVPVDFSEISINAAVYAAKMLTGHYDVNMILHHVYDKPGQAGESIERLEKLKADLMGQGIVKISVLAEEGSDFIHELSKLARHRQADLIIMGITGRSAIGQTFMGSNTLKMVEEKVCPVLIIPGDAKYSDVKNVLLTSDFRDVVASTPSAPIRSILQPFRPALHVIHVNSEIYVSLSESYQAEKEKLRDMFREFNPEFYFLGMFDVEEGINQFAQDKKIDFLIVIHKDQNIFSRFFVKSHTKKLAYQSSIPVLAVHE